MVVLKKGNDQIIQCGKKIDSDVRICPFCGSRQENLINGNGFWDLHPDCEKKRVQQERNMSQYADYIIHTVGSVCSGEKRDAKLLSDCYKNALDLALENGCKSIAFPGISTGAYGYPLQEAATVSLIAVSQWLDAHSDVIMNIYFCCFKYEEFAVYKAFIERK